MEKYYKDILANLISSELHRLNIIWKYAIDIGETESAEFYREEIKKLIQLDTIIWHELK